MKQIMVFCALTALGVFLFNLILGPQDDSILTAISSVFRAQIETQQTVYP